MTVEAFKYYWEQQTKGEDRGKPSLKRTRREDVPDVHGAAKLDTGVAEVMQDRVLKKVSEEVDLTLEECLLKSGREQFEKKLLLEFQQFDGRSEKLELLRSIQRLENLAENDPRNIAIRAQLRSKRKKLQKCTTSSPVSTPPESDDENEEGEPTIRSEKKTLEKHHGKHTSTPPSSDDEEEDDDSDLLPVAGDMDKKQIVQGKIAVRAKADDFLSEKKTTKKIKIEKADQVTTMEDKALKTLQKKTKNHKKS